MRLLINEVAWMGTFTSANDEWIELYNPNNGALNMSGWRLTTLDGNPSIPLSGTIQPKDYFVIAANDTVFSDLHPDLICGSGKSCSFGFGLSNEGEVLQLKDPSGAIIDTANSDGGPWHAGLGYPYYQSMERRGVIKDGFFAWSTYANLNSSTTPMPNPLVHDRLGYVIKGTPGQRNWGPLVTVTPTLKFTPTRTPTVSRTPVKLSTARPTGRIVINEFLPSPGFDWNQDGKVDVKDEFIEITNLGPVDASLVGWKLDDESVGGSSPYTLPSVTLKVGEHLAIYGIRSLISLSDGGDSVRLLNGTNTVIDAYTYTISRPDQAYCRIPDGNGDWYNDCLPTPNLSNKRKGTSPTLPGGNGLQLEPCELPDTLQDDFYLAECHGYGASIWSSIFWDTKGWVDDFLIPAIDSKWQSFVE